MNDKLTHHELTAEWFEDKRGEAILLTQPEDNYDEPSSVIVHPWQLRAVCEQFGIIASDTQSEKTIATLKRRLRVLRDRIGVLAGYLETHEDMTLERTYSKATADIADEFLAEFLIVELDGQP